MLVAHLQHLLCPRDWLAHFRVLPHKKDLCHVEYIDVAIVIELLAIKLETDV